MSWETPKTNWTNSDYFNIDDALRINRNFHELYEMAYNIYTSSSGYYVFFYDYKSGSDSVYYYYSLYTHYHDTQYKDSDYQIDTTSLADKNKRYVLSLANLYYLSQYRWSDFSFESRKVNTIPVSSITKNGVVDPDSLNTRFEFRNFIQKYSFLWNRPTDYSVLNSAQVYLSVKSFENQPFWTSSELNTIESRMLTIYNRFLSYL